MYINIIYILSINWTKRKYRKHRENIGPFNETVFVKREQCFVQRLHVHVAEDIV